MDTREGQHQAVDATKLRSVRPWSTCGQVEEGQGGAGCRVPGAGAKGWSSGRRCTQYIKQALASQKRGWCTLVQVWWDCGSAVQNPRLMTSKDVVPSPFSTHHQAVGVWHVRPVRGVEQLVLRGGAWRAGAADPPAGSYHWVLALLASGARVAYGG